MHNKMITTWVNTFNGAGGIDDDFVCVEVEILSYDHHTGIVKFVPTDDHAYLCVGELAGHTLCWDDDGDYPANWSEFTTEEIFFGSPA